MSEPNTEAYSASKGGIVSMTHALAMSLSPHKIRVNCIAPGWIDVSQHQLSSKVKPVTLKSEDHEQHPVGRVGVPDDISAAAMFLSSPETGFITGTCLTVDGGMTKKMIYVE